MYRGYRSIARIVAGVAALSLGSLPVAAQVRPVDPSDAIDRDLARPASTDRNSDIQAMPPERTYPPAPAPTPYPTSAPYSSAPNAPPPPAPPGPSVPQDNTWARDDIIGAGERVFGKGAAGLAELVEKILADQGRPNAYIAGSEGAGAVVVGLRYGSGVMSHKVEGGRKVHWTGPSVGFDLGGDANKVFILVYNLYDSEELFRRFPAAEGRLYFVGGFAATYLRRDNIVLIPIRLGVGYRAGVNVGYLKFSKKGKWFPF